MQPHVFVWNGMSICADGEQKEGRKNEWQASVSFSAQRQLVKTVSHVFRRGAPARAHAHRVAASHGVGRAARGRIATASSNNNNEHYSNNKYSVFDSAAACAQSVESNAAA